MAMPKGYKHSDEFKRKARERMLGNKHAQGHVSWNKGMRYSLTHAGQFQRGFTPWNKGKKFPQISERFKGKGNPQFGVIHTKEYCDKMSDRLKGRNNYNWKGGIKTEQDGYRLVYEPNHPFARKHGNHKRIYVSEHRLVVEKQIGRYLIPGEVVHHINGIKNDNRIENLMLFNSQRAHRKYEHIVEGIKDGEIIFDGHNCLPK